MTRRIIKISFFFCFLFSSFIFSQKIDKIEVAGNKVFSESEIIGWSGIGIGSKVIPGLIDSVKRNISFAFADRGYLHPRFDSLKLSYPKDTSKANLLVALNEGEPTFIRNVEIDSLHSADSAEIADRFVYLKGQVFNKFEIERLISETLSYYEEKSFPFAAVKIKSVFIDTAKTDDEYFTDLVLEVSYGVKSRIDSIEVIGNDDTKDYVIVRSARVEKGEPYSQKEIDEIPKRLNRLRFFEPVQTPSFYFNNKDVGILQIRVKEKRTNNFDGIIGYIPAANENESGYVTGFVNVSLRNLFGTGRELAFKWEQLDRYSQTLQLKYLEPWLFGYPFNIGFGLYQRKQDTTYVQRKFNGEVSYLATEELSASVTFGASSTIPTASENIVSTVNNSSTYSIGGNILFDSRDDVYAPTEGLFFLTKYSFNTKKFNGVIAPGVSAKQTFQKIEADFGFFVEPFLRNVIAVKIHAREMRGENFEVSDLYRLGGNNTLRGYREDQFLGNRILWMNLEYRFALAKRTYVFGFFDTGYFLRDANEILQTPQTSAWKYGYGFGINLETGIGVLGVSYAVGEDDTISAGKIHFGLLGGF
ncbi:MAG: BamA/TamA family outer membrane protein [Chlorobi bacterium]|nr:BamA/TamA family outer membrane protein [Chlorobiota bacterium]